MNEDFVPFELAVKLKEKGFPQVKKETLAMYNEDGEWFSLAKTLDDFEYSFEDFDDRDCVCPTISQVLKWLRKEKNIHIVIDITNYGFISGTISFKWFKSYCENEIKHYDQKEYSTNEEAALAEIEYVLDNLI